MAVVATYNIHSCVGNDGHLDPERIARVIRELNADVIALQEVDARLGDAGYVDQWAFLAAASGYYCTPGISLRTQRREFGNALLTRHAIHDLQLHDISFEVREPRGAIDATLTIEGRLLRVIATHFGLRRAERRYQAGRLAAIVRDPMSVVPAGTLLLGDLNEWRPGSPSLTALLTNFQPAPAPRSYPALRPLLPLDRIIARGGARLSQILPHRSSLARLASDHLPVRARLSWAETT
jgi:endonuclease/exonuclease/phosphatase family metal-dependent hydrolase